jgi:cytidine deaminase
VRAANRKRNGNVMEKEMIRLAMQARANAYVPYSGFRVGACLQTDSGEFYLGCNIENAGYTATNCAERTAFFKAVSDGRRNFTRIAIMGGYEEETMDFCPPCGVCLQVMMEFCNPETFEIILGNAKGECQVYLLKDLLPMGFRLSK